MCDHHDILTMTITIITSHHQKSSSSSWPHQRSPYSCSVANGTLLAFFPARTPRSTTTTRCSIASFGSSWFRAGIRPVLAKGERASTAKLFGTRSTPASSSTIVGRWRWRTRTSQAPTTASFSSPWTTRPTSTKNTPSLAR